MALTRKTLLRWLIMLVPFLLRFSLDGAVTAALVAGPLVLLGFASLRPRVAPAVVALACLLCFGGAALTAGGQ